VLTLTKINVKNTPSKLKKKIGRVAVTFSCGEREDQLCVVARPKPVASKSLVTWTSTSRRDQVGTDRNSRSTKFLHVRLSQVHATRLLSLLNATRLISITMQ